MKRIIAAGLMTIGLAAPGAADLGDEEYARVNAGLVDHHVLPRIERFSGAAAAFEKAASAMCRAGSGRDLGGVRAAYHAAMDGWTGIEHVHFGPIRREDRRYRLEFWPDKKGLVAKQIRRFLSSRDGKVPAPDRIATMPVTIQGLPAAEYLLFDADAAAAVAAAGGGDRACRLLAAIAGNVAKIAAGLVAEWRGGAKPFVSEILEPGRKGAEFTDHRSVTSEFVGSMNTTLKTVVNLKLDGVLEKDIASARPRRAESWRSSRSMRNIVANLEALQSLYEGRDGLGLKSLLARSDDKLAELFSRAFRKTLATAHAIERPLPRAVADPAARPAVERLAVQVGALQQLVEDGLAAALASSLGFDAMDGD